MRPNTLALALLVAALMTFGPISTDMYLASLPALAEVFATEAGTAQLTLSVYFAGIAVAQLFIGTLSDRFGRRPILIGGLVLFVATSTACALATSIEVLIGLRFCQAFGAASATVLSRAIVRDLHERAGAAHMLARVGSIMGISPVLAPILGSYLFVWFGWQANFWAMAVYGAGAMVFVVLLLGETLARGERAPLRFAAVAFSFARLVRHRIFLGYALPYLFVYAGMFAFFTGFPFIVINLLGQPAEYFGYFFAAVVIGFPIGTFIAGRLTRHFSIDDVLRVAVSLSALSALVVAAFAWAGVTHLLAVMVPMLAYQVTVGMINPLAQASALAPFPEIAGKAAAVMGAGQMGAASLASYLVGATHDGTAIPQLTLVALFGVGVFASYRLLVWKRPLAADDARAA